MRIIAILAAATLSLALSACSKPTQDKTGEDLKAVGHEIGSAAKDVAATPAVQAVGADIKQGASEAADKTKEAARDAGAKIKEGAKDLGAKTDDALNKANADSQKK